MPTRRPCSHSTRAGQPCRAWAVHDTDPPACAAHAGRIVGAGAPLRNQNARTHGFYGRVLDPEELADLVLYAEDMTLDAEIACARIALRRVLLLLSADQADPLPLDDYIRLAGLALQGTRTIARLLRDKRALTQRTADTLDEAFNIALDEIAIELGIEL